MQAVMEEDDNLVAIQEREAAIKSLEVNTLYNTYYITRDGAGHSPSSCECSRIPIRHNLNVCYNSLLVYYTSIL